MKIVTIIGTRPEIIKMSPLLELLNENFEHKLIHSGQHYDPELDRNIFRELKLPLPNVRLKSGSGDFGEQFARQVSLLSTALKKLAPDYVIVQGDTNTAMAGTLVAARLGIGVIHVEAGCRSGNLRAPEEQNRRIIDALAGILLCSDQKALDHLCAEGKKHSARLVGSTTFDAIKRSAKLAPKNFYQTLRLTKEGYILATLHRAENMADMKKFREKITFLNDLSKEMPVVFPVHPRTRKFLDENRIALSPGIITTKPLNHLPFVNLLSQCRIVVTDSGGIQEEAAYFNRPCLVLRGETEWTRLIDAGKNFLLPKVARKERALANRLIGDDEYYNEVRRRKAPGSRPGASRSILRILLKLKKGRSHV